MLEHGSRLKSFKNNGRDLDVNNKKKKFKGAYKLASLLHLNFDNFLNYKGYEKTQNRIKHRAP